jgi:hypothetical protein
MHNAHLWCSDIYCMVFHSFPAQDSAGPETFRTGDVPYWVVSYCMGCFIPTRILVRLILEHFILGRYADGCSV